MHILFVDDTFETRDLFRLCFTLDGHQVDTAHNGPEALRIIEQSSEALDVIIMDYHMPGMSGLEVAQQLKQRNDLTSIPIILFTGDLKEKFENQARDLGVARVIFKPILPAELIAVAQHVVDNPN